MFCGAAAKPQRLLCRPPAERAGKYSPRPATTPARRWYGTCGSGAARCLQVVGGGEVRHPPCVRAPGAGRRPPPGRSRAGRASSSRGVPARAARSTALVLSATVTAIGREACGVAARRCPRSVHTLPPPAPACPSVGEAAAPPAHSHLLTLIVAPHPPPAALILILTGHPRILPNSACRRSRAPRRPLPNRGSDPTKAHGVFLCQTMRTKGNSSSK